MKTKTQHQIAMSEIKFPVTCDKILACSHGNGSDKTLISRTVLWTPGSFDPVQHLFVVRCDGSESRYESLTPAMERYNELP